MAASKKPAAALFWSCVKANWVMGEAAVAKYGGFNDQRDGGKTLQRRTLFRVTACSSGGSNVPLFLGETSVMDLGYC